MEQLLHYVWKHKIFPLMPLQTTSGQPVEVIDPGLPNTDAGPDFFNAKLKINGTLWVGNVELHTQASDWFRHGHNRDTVYDNVILHVVGESDTMPTAVLFPSYCCTVRTMSAGVMTNYVRRKYTLLVIPFLLPYRN